MKRFLSLALVLVLVCLSESSTEQQVRLALTGNPSEMAVSWTSTADQPYYPVVRAKDEQGRQTEHAGTTRHYSAGEYRSGKFHHVVVKGLIPAKNYSYWCGNMITGEFSREFSFTAAKTRPEKIKLAVVGDLGQTENSVRTAKAILNDPEGIDLILMPGDLSYADGFHPRWDSWGRTFEFLSSRIPWMVAPGNHENEEPEKLPFISYQSRFLMPFNRSRATEGNLYWSMDISFAHIVCLSTESNFDTKSRQYKWLLQDLQSVDRIETPWIIIMFHRPIYNSNYAHQGEAAVFKEIYEDVFARYCVDIALSGHVHAYERSERVFKNKRGYTQYFTIGDGGNREGLADKWINPKPMWSAFRKAAYGYSQMIVHNETHLHHAWFSNEKTFYEAEELSPVDAHMPADHLWIERPFPRPRQCVTK